MVSLSQRLSRSDALTSACLHVHVGRALLFCFPCRSQRCHDISRIGSSQKVIRTDLHPYTVHFLNSARVAELNVNADPECSGCISVRSCRSAAEAITPQLSANAEHLAPRARPGLLDHVQQKEPWPEAALPRCVGVMVVPSLRRPASRCRGTLATAGRCSAALAHLCEGIRAGRQTGRLSLCRIQKIKSSRRTPSALRGACSPWAEGGVVREGERRDACRSLLGHLPPYHQQSAGSETFSAHSWQRV